MAVVVPLKDLTVSNHQPAEFTCVLSKPGQTVTWMQGEHVIPLDDDHYKQEVDGATYKLLIPDASMDMNSKFTVTVDDETMTAQLTVIGKKKIGRAHV